VTLHGPRAGRVAVLLLIGCIGLLIRAHEMSADLASLTGISMAIAGMALAGRSPWWGGPLFGLGIGTAFLADGFLPALQVVVLAAALPMAGPKWRTSAYALAMGVGVAVAVPLVVAWPAALVHQSPALAAEWLSQATTTRWSEGITRTTLGDTAYFARILPWYAWPALPLAAWTVWRARRTLKARTDLHLPLAGTVVFFVLLSVLADARDANALPLLIPLVLLGVAELDSLPRGAASALDWFGVTTFALMALVLWVGFVAVMTGSPAAAAAWIQREIPGYQYPFRFVPFALATLLTCLWIAVVARSIRTTRRAVVNWSAGITMVWMLTMMLGLPLIDQARSYRAVALQLASHAPPGKCVLAAGVGEAQHALLDYFAGIRLKPRDGPDAARCEMLLAQFSPGKTPIVDAAKWREEWRGSRPGDRNESLVLYRRVR
jgi:4-amino-4-deoxy-L-arabinose transferase-like glycosyltransferase